MGFKIRLVERLERLEQELLRSAPPGVQTPTNSMTVLNVLDQVDFPLEAVVDRLLSKVLQSLVNKDYVNRQDSDGFTLLHCACALGYATLAKNLLEYPLIITNSAYNDRYGTNVHIKDRYGFTPFHWAVKRGDSVLMNLFGDYVDIEELCTDEGVSDELLESVMNTFAEIDIEDLDLQTDVKDSVQIMYNAFKKKSLEQAATRIQSAYRGHKAREEAKKERELQILRKEAALKILVAYRKHKERFWSNLEKLSPKTKWALKQLERTETVENEAAKKIQKAYKAYQSKAKRKWNT
jgi:hypothetical protein